MDCTYQRYPNASAEAYELTQRLEDEARCRALDAAKDEFGDSAVDTSALRLRSGRASLSAGLDGDEPLPAWDADAWRVRKEMADRAAEEALRDPGSLRVGLVACTKDKRPWPCPARDLYAASTLFRRASAYCRREYDRWYVLSARYGLVHPDTVLEPYDLTLSTMSLDERQAWGQQVSQQLGFLVRRGAVFYAHAGRLYVEPLRAQGIEVVNVLAGLAIGQRLRWYQEQFTKKGRNCTMKDSNENDESKQSEPEAEDALKIRAVRNYGDGRPALLDDGRQVRYTAGGQAVIIRSGQW